MDKNLKIDETALSDLCQRYHIVQLKLFGSAVNGALSPSSDIDLLATFAPSHTPGWEIIEMEQAFASLFDRPVDLLTESSLRPRWRDEVLPSAEVLYAA